MAAWPATLPWLLRDSIRFTPGDFVLRTEMDVGPPQMRRRAAVIYDKLDGDILIIGAQAGTLETFYTTTVQGVGVWTHVHPLTGAAANYRFRDRPTYPSLPMNHDVDNSRLWRVSLALEIIP